MILGITLEEFKELDLAYLSDSFFKECGLPGTFKFGVFHLNWCKILDNNLGALWKLVRDDKIIGMMGAILSPDLNDGELIATEAFWYVLPNYRNSIEGLKMIVHFENWAKQVGAKRVIMAHLLSSMPESLAAYYQRHGFIPVEVNYVKTLV